MKRRQGFVVPLLLITIGFILLFDKLGLIIWGSWGSLWHYWPVILILWGIEIYARNTGSDAVYIMAVFICILVILGTFWLASNGYPRTGKKGEDLRGIIFYTKDLEDKDLNFADLDYADFNNSNLNGADMNFASMQNSNFSNSSLRGVNMNFVDLQNARLDHSDLEGANLNFADLSNADLRNSNLERANMVFVDLDGANMAGARMWGANRVFAGTSKSTICPDSTNGPCW